MDPTKEICCTARNGQWETRNTEWHMFSKDALSQVSMVGFMSFYKTAVTGSILTLLMYLCKILLPILYQKISTSAPRWETSDSWMSWLFSVNFTTHTEWFIGQSEWSS